MASGGSGLGCVVSILDLGSCAALLKWNLEFDLEFNTGGTNFRALFLGIALYK